MQMRLGKNVFYSFLTAATISCGNTHLQKAASPGSDSSFGKGTSSVHCIERNLSPISNEQSKLFGLSDSTIPRVEYVNLGPYSGMYITPDLIQFDTTKINDGYEEIVCIGAVRHEIAHHKMDVLSRTREKRNWPQIYSVNNRNVPVNELDDPMKLKIVGEGLISEGVATYIEINGKTNAPQFPWPPDSGRTYFDYYNHGFYFVKNIMDEFGYEAIMHMGNRLPNKEEILHPQIWQDTIRARILETRR